MHCEEIISDDCIKIKRKKTTKKTLDKLFFEIGKENEQELTAIPLIEKKFHKDELENKFNTSIEIKTTNSKACFDTFNQETPCTKNNNQLEEGLNQIEINQKRINDFKLMIMHDSTKHSYVHCLSKTSDFNHQFRQKRDKARRQLDHSSFFDDGYSSIEHFKDKLKQKEDSGINTQKTCRYQNKKKNCNHNSMSPSIGFNYNFNKGESNKAIYKNTNIDPYIISDTNPSKNHGIENYTAEKINMKMKQRLYAKPQSRNKDGNHSLLSKTTRGAASAFHLHCDIQRQKNLRSSIIKHNSDKQMNSNSNNVIALLDKIRHKYQNEERLKSTKENNLLNEILFLKEKINQTKANNRKSQFNQRPNSVNNKNSAFNMSSSCCLTDNNVLDPNSQHIQKSPNCFDLIKDKNISELIIELGLNAAILNKNKSFFNNEDFNNIIIRTIDTNQEVKSFIKLIINHYQIETKSHLLFEEKTTQLVANDFKLIDKLEKRIKQLEYNLHQYQSQFQSNNLNQSNLTQK